MIKEKIPGKENTHALLSMAEKAIAKNKASADTVQTVAMLLQYRADNFSDTEAYSPDLDL